MSNTHQNAGDPNAGLEERLKLVEAQLQDLVKSQQVILDQLSGPPPKQTSAAPATSTPPMPSVRDYIGDLPAQHTTLTAPPPPHIPRAKPAISTSTKIIQKISPEVIFRWSGALLIVAGAIFMLDNAISRGWIGPWERLGLAYGCALAMLLAGWIYRNHRGWNATLLSAGAAASSATPIAGSVWLELINPNIALVCIALGLALSLGLIRLCRSEIAFTITGLTSVISAIPLIPAVPYTALNWYYSAIVLTAAAISFSIKKIDSDAWTLGRHLSMWPAALMILLISGTAVIRDDSDPLPTTFAVLITATALWLAPMISPQLSKPWLNTLNIRSVFSIPPWTWLALLATVADNETLTAGRLALLIGTGFGLASLPTILLKLPRVLFVAQLFGAGLLITLGLALEFTINAALIALSFNGVALLLIGSLLDSRWLKLNAYVLTVMVLLSSLVNPQLWSLEWADRSGRFLVHSVVVALIALMAGIARRWEPKSWHEVTSAGAWIALISLVAAGLMPSVDLNLDLLLLTLITAATFLAARWLGHITKVIGLFLAFPVALTGSLKSLSAIEGGEPWVGDIANFACLIVLIAGLYYLHKKTTWKDTPFILIGWLALLTWSTSVTLDLPQGQVVTSASWTLLATGLILLGIFLSHSGFRWAGVATLAITMIKLFTVDLVAINVLWRVGLFFLLGVGLLYMAYVLPRLDSEAVGE